MYGVLTYDPYGQFVHAGGHSDRGTPSPSISVLKERQISLKCIALIYLQPISTPCVYILSLKSILIMPI